MHWTSALPRLLPPLGSIALVACLGAEPALAWDPAESKQPVSAAQGPNLFTLDSPLAASPQAKAFIEWRLAQWESEKASVLALADELIGHFSHRTMVLKSDINDELQISEHNRGHEEECISNGPESRLSGLLTSEARDFIDRTLPLVYKQSASEEALAQKYKLLVKTCAYDEGSFALLADLHIQDLYRQIDHSARNVAALVRRSGAPRDRYMQIIGHMHSLNGHCQGLNEVNRFVLEWLRQAGSRIEADLRMLKANLATPERISLPGTEAAEPKEVEVAEAAEAKQEAPEDAVEEKRAEAPVESKRPAGEPRSAAATPGPLDGFYRFVACEQRPRPVTAAFRVGKRAALIRSQVATGSRDLTSDAVIRLTRALEPYGARCEKHRKGIMIKLPAADPEQRFVAKFIHRSHAAHDSFDCHSAAALRELFDASVFSLARFQ